MKSKVFALLDAWKEDYAQTLMRYVEVPSLKAAPLPNAPFGAEVRRMLDMAMEDCRRFGFVTRDFDGYAADATLGDAPEAIAVLAHLDVVPAGDGWDTPPFEAVRKDDLVYGRGTGDDKGPAIAAMYAMRAIREAGVPLKRSIRLILGCDEESGWDDMAYYCAHTEMPETGFSPDASFPLINTEKAMLSLGISASLSPEGLQVLEIYTGERMNVIPGESVCVVSGGAETVDAVRAFSQETGMDYKAELTDKGVRITATGIPGHSAYPAGRRNAIGMMLVLLRRLGVQGPLAALADLYGMESNGASLGIAYSDEVSGALTCNMGILHLENGRVYATLDNRVPITADLDQMEKTLREKLSGFTIEHLKKTAPHHVPADSELVTCLLGAYHDNTGLPAVPEYTGGGTYAKVLKQGVAFGAYFPDDPDLAHQANEYVNLNKMILAAKIYADALMRLCAE